MRSQPANLTIALQLLFACLHPIPSDIALTMSVLASTHHLAYILGFPVALAYTAVSAAFLHSMRGGGFNQAIGEVILGAAAALYFGVQ